MHMDQWNIVEGHGRMVTKGYEVSKECFLRRRAFDIKGDNEKVVHKNKEKGVTISCIDKCLQRT